MKSAFSRFAGRLAMKSWSLVFPLGMVLAAPVVMGQTSATFLNQGNLIYLGPGATGNTVASPPQINATNFINTGFMELIAYPLPFQTASTLNFTNTGEMVGEIGWEFDYSTATGSSSGRTVAANFFNGPYNPNVTPVKGFIESVSGGLPNPTSSSGNSSSLVYQQGYLWVSATNVINKGMLASDAYSETRLIATNMDLSRGYVYITPISSIGSANGRTNFVSDTAIYDQYWWQTNTPAPLFDSTGLWNGGIAVSQPYDFSAPCNLTGVGFQSAFVPTASDSFATAFGNATVLATNIINESPPFTNVLAADIVVSTNVFPTNLIHQAVFVNVGDPNITATIGFTPSTTRNNRYQTVDVELFDTLTGDSLFVMDTLASSATRGLLPNSIVYPAAECSGVTYRPANYVVERNFGGVGTPGLGTPTNNFLYNTNWLQTGTNAIYADYGCFVDNQASEPPTQPGSIINNASAVTNLTGRIHIYAGNLNLFNTQMRGEGEVVIQTRHLVGSQNASIDCENLSYNLGSTNGFLNMSDLAPASVLRFHGSNTMWSAVWTNLNMVLTPSYIFSNILSSNMVVTVTNIPPDPTPVNVTNFVAVTNISAFYAPETNFVVIGLHDMMLDASQLKTTSPVTVYDLLLHSTNNIVITDPVNVIETFLLDGPAFTLNGSLTFPGIAPIDPLSGTPFSGAPIQTWVYSMAPTLRYFTNNGVLSIPSSSHFGDDGPTNYLAFINNGVIVASDQTINSANVQINNGVNEALASDFTVTADTAVISNAEIFAAGNINLSANSLMIDPSILSAYYAINFNVTGSLSDGGLGAGNAFQCQNGFNLLLKPAVGDLWGTTITSLTYYGEEVDHLWAGDDRGPNAVGYTNNVALNDLVLSPQYVSAPYYPLFFFAGTTGNNGMYVGTLDLSQLGDIGGLTNMMAIDPSLTIYYAHLLLGFVPPGGATPEQYMDGQFGGHLRWVKNFDAFSAAAVSLPPKPKLSASLLKSKGQFNLTVTGTPGQTYVIQASTNLVDWMPIFTNSASVNGLIQFMDSTAPNYSSRFYRVVSP